MNGLSWIIYLAGVSDALSTLFRILGTAMIIITVVTTLLSFEYDRYDRTTQETQSARTKFRRYGTASGVLCFIFFLIVCVLPSKDTVYAITASQVGKQILKSNTANLAEQALNSWLKKQIAPPVATAPAASN